MFLETLRNYLKSRGKMLKSLMETAGQKSLKIELEALFWYFPRNQYYRRFMELYNVLKKRKDNEIRISDDARIILKEDHIVVTRETLSKLLESKEE